MRLMVLVIAWVWRSEASSSPDNKMITAICPCLKATDCQDQGVPESKVILADNTPCPLGLARCCYFPSSFEQDSYLTTSATPSMLQLVAMLTSVKVDPKRKLNFMLKTQVGNTTTELPSPNRTPPPPPRHPPGVSWERRHSDTPPYFRLVLTPDRTRKTPFNINVAAAASEDWPSKTKRQVNIIGPVPRRWKGPPAPHSTQDGILQSELQLPNPPSPKKALSPEDYRNLLKEYRDTLELYSRLLQQQSSSKTTS